MPDLMLAKCAEALALRKAFPNDLSGIYSDEEMAQADVPEERIKPKKVDLHLATPTEPVNINGVNWEVLKTALDNLSDVDSVKNFWNARKEILDAIDILEDKLGIDEEDKLNAYDSDSDSDSDSD